jgi:hypothetical protein
VSVPDDGAPGIEPGPLVVAVVAVVVMVRVVVRLDGAAEGSRWWTIGDTPGRREGAAEQRETERLTTAAPTPWTARAATHRTPWHDLDP